MKDHLHMFVSGIMQGSSHEMGICKQDYRQEIAAVMQQHHPEVEIIDPYTLYPDSVNFGREQAVATFLSLLDKAAEADILVAYLPRASMGTTLEIWHAYQAEKPVIVISPMDQNWTLWATATHIVPDLPAFVRFVEQGGLKPLLPQTKK